MNENVKKRNDVITVSRIIGMFSIVLCHIIRYYTFVPGHKSLGMFFRCGVELFLFISGYLYGGKVVTNVKKWYFSRVKKIALPAIIVSVIAIISNVIVREYVSVPTAIAYLFNLQGLLFLSYKTFSRYFCSVGSLGHLWFVTVIMLCYITVPALQKVSLERKITEKFITIFCFAGVVISAVLLDYIAISYFLVFTVGYFAGKIKLLDRINTKYICFFTIFFIGVLIGRVLIHKSLDDTLAYREYVMLTQPIIGIYWVLLLAYINTRKKCIKVLASTKVVSLMNDYSYYVYLVHGVFCMGVFNVYSSISSIWIASLAFVLLTISSACIVKKVIKIQSFWGNIE